MRDNDDGNNDGNDDEHKTTMAGGRLFVWLLCSFSTHTMGDLLSHTCYATPRLCSDHFSYLDMTQNLSTVIIAQNMMKTIGYIAIDWLIDRG
jgi:hypothetical protein